MVLGALLGLSQRNTELTQLPIGGALSPSGFGVNRALPPSGFGLGLSRRYATAQGGGGGADVPRAIAWQVTPPPRAPPPPPPAGPAWRGAARRAR